MKLRFFQRLFLPVLLIAVLAGVVVVTGGGGFSKNEKEAWPADPNTGSRDPKAVMVTVEPVVLRPVQRTIEVNGSLTGYEEITISSKVEGRVQRVRKLVSEHVQPGQVILEIDPIDADLAAQQAEKGLLVELARLGMSEVPIGEYDLTQIPAVKLASVKLENAKSKLERARKLPKEAVSSEEIADRLADVRTTQVEYDSQIHLAKVGLATIQMKQEALRIARQQQRDTTLLAPVPTLAVPGKSPSEVDYTVAQRLVGEGTLVRVGTEVFKLVIDSVLTLRVAVPERHPLSGDLRVGQEAKIWTSGIPTPVRGVVERIHPTVDTATRTFEVELRITNEDRKLKSGSFAKAAILTRLDEKTTTVPLEAVVSFAGITKIFVAENGKAKEVLVTLGVQNDSWVEIVSPKLPTTSQIITSGQSALADETPIALREAETRNSVGKRR